MAVSLNNTGSQQNVSITGKQISIKFAVDDFSVLLTFNLAPLSGPNINVANTGSWPCISKTACQRNPDDFGDSVTFPPIAPLG